MQKEAPRSSCATRRVARSLEFSADIPEALEVLLAAGRDGFRVERPLAGRV
jgi:hypothetical protein